MTPTFKKLLVASLVVSLTLSLLMLQTRGEATVDSHLGNIGTAVSGGSLEDLERALEKISPEGLYLGDVDPACLEKVVPEGVECPYEDREALLDALWERIGDLPGDRETP